MPRVYKVWVFVKSSHDLNSLMFQTFSCSLLLSMLILDSCCSTLSIYQNFLFFLSVPVLSYTGSSCRKFQIKQWQFLYINEHILQKNRHIPQLASSELSWQSLSPSQMYAGLVQMPVPHWNCPGLQLNSAVVEEVEVTRCFKIIPTNISLLNCGLRWDQKV